MASDPEPTAAPSAAPPPPSPRWRVSVLIPLLTLLAVSAGVLIESARRGPPPELALAAPPTATLAPLVPIVGDHVLAGQLLDSTGVPVADALVLALSGDEPVWTWSDAEGRYRLEGLLEGPWRVSVVPRGYGPWEGTLGEADGDLNLGAPNPPAPTVPALARSPLAGRVLPAVPFALDGCEVHFVPTTVFEDFDSPFPRRIEVDAGGRFDVVDLAQGSYRVELRPRWAKGGTWPDLVRPLTGEALVWEHPPDPPTDLVLPLANGGLRGRVLDTDGVPVEGALVLIAREDDADRIWPPIATDRDGAFTATDLPAGTYRVAIRAGEVARDIVADVSTGETRVVALRPFDLR